MGRVWKVEFAQTDVERHVKVWAGYSRLCHYLRGENG